MRHLKKYQKLWVILITIMLGVLPEIGFCFGFGQIKLYSYLNEPLDAEIELLGAEDTDPSSLIATLASAQDFKRAGIARPYFLSKIRFEVQKQKNNYVVRIRTEDPVKQPYLEFITVLTWQQGRLMRGYTLLLDPAPLDSASKRELEDFIAPGMSKGDKDPVKKMQEKLSKSLSLGKSAMVARNEGPTTDVYSGENFPANQIDPRNIAGQNLENLFEPEPEPKKETLSLHLQKAPPVSIESSEMSVSEGSEEGTSISPPLDPQDLPALAVESSSRRETGWFVGLYENKLLLGSSLALMFSITFTVWFLRRARETLVVSVEEQKPISGKTPNMIVIKITHSF